MKSSTTTTAINIKIKHPNNITFVARDIDGMTILVPPGTEFDASQIKGLKKMKDEFIKNFNASCPSPRPSNIDIEIEEHPDGTASVRQLITTTSITEYNIPSSEMQSDDCNILNRLFTPPKEEKKKTDGHCARLKKMCRIL